MAVTSREQFKQYILRRLGAPVVNIEVSDEQLEDRIDDALQYYRDYHFDGTEKVYIPHQLTAQDIENKYIVLPDIVVGVTSIWPLVSTVSSSSMFSATYQFALNDFFNISATQLSAYVSAMQNIALVQEILVGQQPIRYNRHTDKLYIDMNWEKIRVGEYIMIDGYVALDSNVYSQIWGDRWLQRYATALVAKQWGTNLSKFVGMQMPGGLTFDGQRILADADNEINRLEEEMINSYSLPVYDMIG